MARPSRQSRAARGLRHRLPDPVRLHRHLHLREFRPGPPALRRRHDDAGRGLLRVPALDRHDAARRPGRRPLRHAADPVGLVRRRGGRTAAAAEPELRGPTGRARAARRRNLLCAGDSHRLRRPRRHDRSRLGERALPRQLLPRWPRRQRRAGPGLRPDRLAGLASPASASRLRSAPCSPRGSPCTPPRSQRPRSPHRAETQSHPRRTSCPTASPRPVRPRFWPLLC